MTREYICMGLVLVLAIAGMVAAYWRGKYVERIRIIRRFVEAGVDFDRDIFSTIHLAQILFDDKKITYVESKIHAKEVTGISKRG